MKLNFKKALPTDLPYIVDVYNQSIPSRMATADLSPVSVGESKQWFNKRHEIRPIWMINTDDRSIGWVSLSSFYGRSAYRHTVEISIYIDKQYQHLGIGKKVLRFIQNVAPKLQIYTILAFIFAHNAPSLKLFKDQGYKQYGHLPNVAEMDGKKRSLDILGLKVNE